MKGTKTLLLTGLALLIGAASGQTLTREELLKGLAVGWLTYNGDYSGRRYSPLDQINASNVHTLSLAWMSRFTADYGGVQIKSTPLMVNGILYFTAPNSVWAADARTGRQIWHYQYPQNTGSTIGNRGVGMYGDWLFFESPDSHLISLDAKTGQERWRVEIADPKLDYTSTVAPVIVGNHVLVGIGGDHLDNPGFLESRDPETGALQWKWWTTPRKGEPGIETWPSDQAAVHGTGQTWIPGTYDPELNLYYIGTGNPNPVLAGQGRKGDNLYTCSIVALNPDTGKLVWYYQVNPHDTHDWDAVQTPVLIDGVIDGRPRKLLAQASRNGYFFVLDRTNGNHILTQPYISSVNWSKGINARGQPVPNPDKEPKTDGVLVSPAEGGGTNWPAPSFSPETGLFYVGTTSGYALYYVTDDDDFPVGWGGRDIAVGSDGSALTAIDYRTGKIVWRHEWPGGGGPSHILTTAGKLLFTHNQNYLIAFDPANGTILWHAGLAAAPTAGLITYLLDGKQYVLVAAADSLYAFTVNRPVN
jgi:alcohol dehydrogenase (cytochrome c)